LQGKGRRVCRGRKRVEISFENIFFYKIPLLYNSYIPKPPLLAAEPNNFFASQKTAEKIRLSRKTAEILFFC